MFQRFFEEGLAQASFLIGCERTKKAIVIDPRRDASIYTAAAAQAGATIVAAIETHVHADFVSGARELAAKGADVFAGPRSGLEFPHRTVQDGETLRFGDLTITGLHTPGHTPEHICVLVTDRTRADEPWFVLTGHTLMVGDLGRTELAVSAEEGARQLFRSARKLKALPDDVEVMPGAYAGSVCGRRLSGKPWSTIGFEKRHNEAFMIEDEAAFVGFMVAEIPPAPPEAKRIRAANSGIAAAAA